MILLKTLKVTFLATIGGPVLGVAVTGLILLMLVLVILPGWLEILVLQCDKPSGWLRRTVGSCWRLASKIIKPEEKSQIGPA
jgi:hypothetical protein